MAVKIRLTRAGAKKAPFYRIVAADSRSPRDGRFIEILGRYNPRTQPSTIEVDVEKVEAWVAKGAQMSDTVARLLAIAKNPEAKVPETGEKLSKKAKAKAAAESDAAAKPTQTPAAEEVVAEEPASEDAAEAEASAETAEQEAPEESAVDNAADEPMATERTDEGVAQEPGDDEPATDDDNTEEE